MIAIQSDDHQWHLFSDGHYVFVRADILTVLTEKDDEIGGVPMARVVVWSATAPVTTTTPPSGASA